MISGVRASSTRIEFDFVDDGVGVAALDHFLQPEFHVVAQIVEAKFVIGGVGDVALVSLFTLGVVEPVHDVADGEAEELIDLSHPLGVALGEIIVDGDDMHAQSGERVEIDRERGDQRLAFAGLHLGDLAVVQDHAADQLHVEMALTDGALGGFAHGGEGRHQNVVECLAVGQLLLEVAGAGAQGLIGERRDFRLERIDFSDARQIGADRPLIGGAEQFAEEAFEHQGELQIVDGRLLARHSGRVCFRRSGNTALFGQIRREPGSQRATQPGLFLR